MPTDADIYEMVSGSAAGEDARGDIQRSVELLQVHYGCRRS